MDLTKNFPRSPKERLSGVAMLARTIDKARAKEAGTLGDYYYDCSMDRRLFRTLAIDAGEFSAVVARSGGDDGVIAWLLSRPPIAQVELDEHNQAIDAWKPSSPEGRARFERERELVAPGRSDIATWTDLIEVEEGRVAAERR